MQIEWLADTSLGAMLGDYISVSYVKGKAVPVVALAGPPSALGYSESIFTCKLKRAAAAHARRHQLTVSTSVALTNAMRWLNEIS